MFQDEWLAWDRELIVIKKLLENARSEGRFQLVSGRQGGRVLRDGLILKVSRLVIIKYSHGRASPCKLCCVPRRLAMGRWVERVFKLSSRSRRVTLRAIA